MSSRSEYIAALAGFGTPTFAAWAFGLSFGVFAAALVLMFVKSPAALRRQALIPFDHNDTEHGCD